MWIWIQFDAAVGHRFFSYVLRHWKLSIKRLKNWENWKINSTQEFISIRFRDLTLKKSGPQYSGESLFSHCNTPPAELRGSYLRKCSGCFGEDFLDSHIRSCSTNQSMTYIWEPKCVWLLWLVHELNFHRNKSCSALFHTYSLFYSTNAFFPSDSPTFFFICTYSTFWFLHDFKMTTPKSQLSKTPLCTCRKSCLKILSTFLRFLR